jgi:hypothetical protein
VVDYRGEHIRVIRTGYSHHGIGIGNSEVVHFAYSSLAYGWGKIERATLAEFAAGVEIEVVPGRHKFGSDAIVSRALSHLGREGYNPISNNCEHFALWCVSDRHRSPQADLWMGMISPYHRYSNFMRDLSDNLMDNMYENVGGPEFWAEWEKRQKQAERAIREGYDHILVGEPFDNR